MNGHHVKAVYLIFSAFAFVGSSIPVSAIAQPIGSSNSADPRAIPTNLSGSDSTLHRALIASSPQVAARRLALRAAEARARAAGNRSAASLTGEAEEIPGGLDLANAGSLRIELEQDFLGKSMRSAQRRLATSEVAIAHAAITVTEGRLLAALDRDLMRLAGWSAIARRLASEDDLFGSAEASIRGRFAAGDARYVDVLRLRTERLRVQSERAIAVMEAGAAHTAIIGLFGATDTADRLSAILDSVARAEPTLIVGPIPGIDSLLSISGAMLFSNARIARAAALRRLTLAAQNPRITASLGAQRFQTGKGRYTIGPALSFSTTLPFTARKANYARAQAADLELRAEEGEQRGRLASLRSVISVAHARYQAARNRLGVYEAALLRGAREERESALASYRSGELTLTELLDFERGLARAEVDRLRASIEAAEAHSRVYTSLDEPDQIDPRNSQ